jgi:CYTH domain-containing protein
MALCHQPVIDKTRHEVMHDGMLWEVDVFHGANEGLIVAEIELPAEDTSFTLPDWIGEEVSHDPALHELPSLSGAFHGVVMACSCSFSGGGRWLWI